MRRPTIKDSAEYFRRALEVGLCRESDVEAWADKMIAESNADIPTWLLDLSIGGENSKAKTLGAVPGEPDNLTVWNLVLAHLGKASRAGRFSREQVVRVLFRWAVNREIPSPMLSAAYRLDDGFDGAREGWYSEGQFVQDFEGFFDQFRSAERLLPETALSPLS
jgi:hypothetical protein